MHALSLSLFWRLLVIVVVAAAAEPGFARNQTRAQVVQTVGHGQEAFVVGLSPDDAVVLSGSGDGTLKLWDAATGRLLRTLDAHAGGVTAGTFSLDGNLLASAGADKKVRLWDAKSGMLIRELEGTHETVSITFLNQDSHVVAGSLRNDIIIWNAVSGQILRTVSGHTGPILSVVVSRDGKKIASGSIDKTIRIWEASSGNALGKIDTKEFFALAFAPDNLRLASSAGLDVTIWDTSTGKAELRIKPQGITTSISFSPDGARLLTAGKNKALKVWETRGGTLLESIDRPSAVSEFSQSMAAFSSDGSFIIGTYEGAPGLWQAETSKLVRRFPNARPGVDFVAVSRNGEHVAWGAGGEMWVLGCKGRETVKGLPRDRPLGEGRVILTRRRTHRDATLIHPQWSGPTRGMA